jgi:predicted DCC family thiol-disulfide oxidoreductase YuxK
MSRSPLLLVYDAEDPRCRGVADWVGRHDRDGLVVAFPYQNTQLVTLAPELAGMPFLHQVITLDLETRAVREGRDIVPGILGRLPGWAWFRPVARLPWAAGLVFRLIRR